MKMVGHQAPTQDPHRQPLFGVDEELEKGVEVFGLVKHRGPAVATVQDVVA
jgi:hypothetical protein